MKFAVKQAYDMLMRWGPDDCWSGWRLLWGLKVQQRVKDCVWLLAHGWVLTNELQWKRGVTNLARCQQCDAPIEDVLHIVRDCLCAQDVWDLLHPQGQVADFFVLPLKPWLLRIWNSGIQLMAASHGLRRHRSLVGLYGVGEIWPS